ncbi:hypothetical protein PHLGIDRAFT_165546 [Phlebiopsis gigantea 11061_1 CR5-6]|uniref:Uncharacterized protein n=1 Tax=Phlebiopsis gigantea (strain 11061_1 CR5-6) TaxID=745531 RepID=A0A0C3S4R0_PHLG1|nr:hypothetical protein PHLGIDRAFT_165546 [Phlebiopsis gigantea 11061_1 CR5-6]
MASGSPRALSIAVDYRTLTENSNLSHRHALQPSRLTLILSTALTMVAYSSVAQRLPKFSAAELTASGKATSMPNTNGLMSPRPYQYCSLRSRTLVSHS